MLCGRRQLYQLGRDQLRMLTYNGQPKSSALPPFRRAAPLIPSIRRGLLSSDLQHRSFSSQHICCQDAKAPSSSVPVNGERTPIGQVEPRLAITFTCAVPDCGHRSTHEFSKRSYTKGIVIIQCPGCKNRHLIADNLSWFTENADEPRNIEQIIAAKGGKVKRGTVFSDGLDGETLEIEDAAEETDKPVS